MSREAELADLDRLIEMSRSYYDTYEPAWPFSEAELRNLYSTLIEKQDGYLIISDGGFLGALKHPNLFNPGWTIASELLWWGDADLIRQFRKWARGADEIRYSCPPNSKATKLFRRLGDPVEFVYSEETPCV